MSTTPSPSSGPCPPSQRHLDALATNGGEKSGLEKILQRADIWHGGAAPSVSGLPSGYPALDAPLGGGWSPGALTEILIPHTGSGELRLLLPALARLSREKRWLAFVAPPYIPYAPALARAGIDLSHVLLIHPHGGQEALWAVEQALRTGTCSAVLAWPTVASRQVLRRLQLAAEAGGTFGVLFRPARCARDSSPAALRLRLAPTATGVDVHIVKRRGGWPTGPVTLELDHALAMPPPAPSSTRRLHPRRRRT